MEQIKQTAVEWLQEAISKKVNNELGPYFIDLFDNAKAMEKEQMFDYIKKHYVIGENSLKFHQEQFEQYYNETYGK